MNNWSDNLLNKIENIISNALSGNKGEKKVEQELNKILDKNKYKIYRNVVLPEKKFDIDFVILTPYGLIIFEVKNWKDKVKFYEKHYERIKQKSEFRREITEWYINDPRERMEWTRNNLRRYLNDQDIDNKNISIQKAVVFPHSVATWKGDTSTYIISGLEGLKKFFDNNNKKVEISEDNYKKLEDLFEKLT